MTVSYRCTDTTQCMDPDLCEWLFDGGDASTGINSAWVCQICGMVNADREPPSYDDDVL